QVAEDDAQQRGLARTVGADDSDPVAALNGDIEVADQWPRTKAMRDAAQLGNQLSGALAIGQREADLALLFATSGALAAQGLQAPDPAFVARAPRLDALADPDLFLAQQLVETRLSQSFGFQPLCLAHLPGAEIARKAQQASTVQLDDARGHHIEKSAVV